jgi:hypothetical protein
MSVILTDAAPTGEFERLPKASRRVQPTFRTIRVTGCRQGLQRVQGAAAKTKLGVVVVFMTTAP